MSNNWCTDKGISPNCLHMSQFTDYSFIFCNFLHCTFRTFGSYKIEKVHSEVHKWSFEDTVLIKGLKSSSLIWFWAVCADALCACFHFTRAPGNYFFSEPNNAASSLSWMESDRVHSVSVVIQMTMKGCLFTHSESLLSKEICSRAGDGQWECGHGEMWWKVGKLDMH